MIQYLDRAQRKEMRGSGDGEDGGPDDPDPAPMRIDYGR
jgi:hypothetical protein